MTAGGITGTVQINTVGTAQVQALVQAVQKLAPELLKLIPGANGVDAAMVKQAGSISKTLNLYRQAASLASTWAQAQIRAGEAAKTGGNATAVLTNALNANKAALQSLTGTTAASYASKSRTIDLTRQQTTVLLQSAAAAKTAAEAQLILAKAEQQQLQTANLAAGKGAPLTAYQSATLALQRKAQAAKLAADAQTRADAADQRAAAAAARLAAAANQATTAEQKKAAAALAAARAAQAEAASNDNNTRSIKGSYFALYQVAAAYALVSKASTSVITGTVGAAASFQAAFNQVIRTSDLLDGALENTVGKTALLYDQLVNLSETTPVAFEDISGIAALGGQLGIASGDIANFTGVVAQFAAVTNVSTDAAATGFGRITNLLGVSSSDYDRLASTIGDLGVKSAATETEILANTQSIAATGKQAGYSTEFILGLATSLSSLKVPAELSRGTLTRTLQLISKSAADGAAGMEPFAKVLNLTADATLALQKNNPQAFFTQLIQGLSVASANGQDLNIVLDDLGIKNSRDVPVIERLAGNYTLLANSIQEAYKEYNAPVNTNYLALATAKVFSGLKAQGAELGNTFRAVFANIGGPALAPLEALAGALKFILQQLQKLPTAITAPVLAIAGVVAVFAAYRAALALAIAGTLAFRAALNGSAVGTGLTFSTLRTAARETFGTVATSAEAAGATTAAANGTIAASSEAAALALRTEAAAQAQLSNAIAVGMGAETRLIAQNILTANGAGVTAAFLNNEAQAVLRTGTAAQVAALQISYLQAATAIEAIETEGAAASANVFVASLLREEAAALTVIPALGGVAAAEGAVAGGAAAAGTATKIFGGPIFLGLVIAAGALAALAGAFHDSDSAAEAAAATMQKYKDKLLETAGGADALTAAVKADTDAFASTGDASGGFEKLVRVVTDLHDGTARVTDEWQKMDGTIINNAAEPAIYKYASSTKTLADGSVVAASGQDALGHAVGLTTTQLERQTVVIGKQTAAIAAKAIADAVGGDKGQGGILSPAEITKANQQLAAQGKTLGQVLGGAFNNGISSVKDAFAPIIAADEARIKALRDLLQETGSSQGEQAGQGEQVAAEIAALQTEIDKYNSLTGAVGGTNSVLADLVQQQVLLNDSLSGAGVDDLNTEYEGLADTTKNLATATGTLADALSAVADNFTQVENSAFTMSDALSASQASIEALSASVVNNGIDFSNYSEAGRSNLAALEQAVNDYTATQAAAIQNGTITAEQGASNVQHFVMTLVNSLATQGVDTSQIDFLVNYVNQVTANPGILTITADGTPAMSVINDVINGANAASIAMAAAGINSGPGEDRATRLSNPGPGEDRMTRLGNPANSDNVAQNQARQEAQKLDTQAALDSGRAQAQYAKDLAAAKIADQAAGQAAQDAASTNKDNAKAAKQAGQAQKDAADQAAQALQKQEQYIKDVGSYYAGLGSDALSAATNQGKTVDALDKLGTSIATNGTSFSTFSEAGRSNLDALGSALDSYGQVLNDKLTEGSISVSQAGSMFSQYAGGVREDLLKMGVPLTTVNAYFEQLNAGNGWAQASSDVKQYSGVAVQAGKDAAAMGDASTAATDKAGVSAKQLADYYSAVDDYFKGITEGAFKFITAEGDVFESIQKLGQSLADNGTAFNSLTDNGRQNFSALSDVFSKFGDNLKVRISAGIITAQQGSKEMSDFAGGIYNDLINLGAKASDIAPYFKALGFDTKGFGAGDAAVKQYAGVLGAAASAARAAAQGTDALSTAMQIAADYASRLDDALGTAFDRLHGLANAQDAVTTAVRGLSDAYQANIDKVKDLANANKGLIADRQSAQVDYDKANRAYMLAIKYGQKDAAAKFLADRNTAGAKISDDTSQIGANNKATEDIKKNSKELVGNSQYAIENRASFIDLQKTMLDQIDAYAKTGATTKQVTDYTEKLKKQFAAAGLAAGYSRSEIQKYVNNFATYVAVIKSVPRIVKTTLLADTSGASAALNALPKSGVFTTVARADTRGAMTALRGIPKLARYDITAHIPQGTAPVLAVLRTIPKTADYRVNAVVAGGTAGVAGTLTRAGLKSGGYTVNVDRVNAAKVNTELNNIIGAVRTAGAITFDAVKTLILNVTGTATVNSMDIRSVNSPGQPGTHWAGGMAGYSSGGQLGGTPPVNRKQDNLIGTVAGKPLSLRSREWIMPEEAVDYYGTGQMSAWQHRQTPRTYGNTAAFASGGQAGSNSWYTSSGSDQPMIAQLATEDRRLLRQVAQRPIVADLDGRRVSKAQSADNARARRAGVSA